MGSPMRITYSPSVDAAYIYLQDLIKPCEAKKTYTCNANAVNGMINLDFDSEGRLLGIEVLDASRLLSDAILRHADRIGGSDTSGVAS